MILSQVLNYFGAQVEKKAGASTSAEEIITVINESIQTWPKDTLQVLDIMILNRSNQ